MLVCGLVEKTKEGAAMRMQGRGGRSLKSQVDQESRGQGGLLELVPGMEKPFPFASLQQGRWPHTVQIFFWKDSR